MAVPTHRALRAVIDAASERGLPVDRPRILRDGTNVLVHLEPAPVIGRVPLTLARLRTRAWFEQEVELARFLSAAGAPVAAPCTDPDPGPDERDGLLVTFWQHVDQDPARFEPALVGRSLRELHEALATYVRPLPSFDRLDEVRLHPRPTWRRFEASPTGFPHPLRTAGGRCTVTRTSTTCCGARKVRSGRISRTPALARSNTTSRACSGETRP